MSVELPIAGSTFRERSREALAGDGRLQAALRFATDSVEERRAAALRELEDPDALRDAARALRGATLRRLPELLGQFADNLEAAGGRVFFAADAREACDYFLELCERRGARAVAKSKSMASEEIELNQALEANGIEVTETDLGEWVQQLDGEIPSHIVFPAAHKDREGWAEVFRKRFGGEVSSDAQDLTAFARERMRERFQQADIGMSGCNFAVAETGTVVMMTNEGNARMCTTLPPVHVAIMGMERVAATWSELDLMMSLLPRSGAGQSITSYVNCVTGPRRPGELDGPAELHVIVVDNGRSKLLGTALQEALHCIRCGACLNVCPVFRQVGGHAYGWVYSGPIGAVLTPHLLDRPEARELSQASSLCGACWKACPVRIPLHDLLLEGRRQEVAADPPAGRLAWKAWAAAWSRPALFAASGRPARRPPPRALLLPPFRNWTKGRALPRRHGATFRTRWKRGEV